MLCPVKKNAKHILKGLFRKMRSVECTEHFKGFSVNFINQIARTLDAQLTSCLLVQWFHHTGNLFLESKA